MIIQANDCQIRGLFIAFVKTNCCSASFTDNTSKWLAFVVSSKNQHFACAPEYSRNLLSEQHFCLQRKDHF